MAIIGVLSVGGIAGYSKAMMKYRINKTIEQITLIAGNVRSFFGPQRSYSGLDSSTSEGIKLIKKANLVPNEMIDITLHEIQAGNLLKSYILHEWGYPLYIIADDKYGGAGTDGVSDKHAFTIYLPYIPTEACIEIATHDWTSANAFAVYVDNINHQEGMDEYTDVLKIPADMERVIKACSSDDGLGNLILYFDVDITKGVWPYDLDS